jgi:leukotriene-A4 hydrolase
MHPVFAVVAVAAVVAAASGSRDIHSYARPDLVVVRHIDLDLTIHFDEKRLDGVAVLHVEKTAAGKEAPLVLDTRDLDIHTIATSTDGKKFQPTTFKLGAVDAILGAPLTITLPPKVMAVRIEYSAGARATGLQWLEPAQTAGKRYPYLFTQSECIHARSWIPLQDSPAIRVTYTARVHVPSALGAVMSAEGNAGAAVERLREPKGPWRVFSFRMDKRIPPYLISLAAGDLAFRKLGPRSGVYAEPSVVDRAAHEFEDVESMIAAVEKLYGPYRWGRYDLLILPPSFAYGGMENPMLTFASPTVLAGDKSLVSLMSHELAHSWSGNLVTNATASDFWLNEGFTVYVDRRILEVVYGPDRAAMEAVLGRQTLEREQAKLPEKDRVLHIDLEGRDPDDAITAVPYEKGFLFLKHLEETFGRQRFDDFLRGYFDHFAFQSITTAQFRDYLQQNLLSRDPALAAKVPVDEWLQGTTIPANAPRAQFDGFAKVEAAASDWLAGKLSIDALQGATKDWSYYYWDHFLHALPEDVGAAKLKELDDVFHFTQAGNAHLASEWLQIAIRNRYEPAYERLEEFLTSVGRGRLIRPLYEELVKSDEGKARALAIYAKARSGYQVPVAAMIGKLVGWSESPKS